MSLPSYQTAANWYEHALPATGIIRIAADDVVLVGLPAIVAGFLLSFVSSMLRKRTKKITPGDIAAKMFALGLFAYPIMMMLYLDAVADWHINRLIPGVVISLVVGLPMIAGSGLLWLADRSWEVAGRPLLIFSSIVFVVSCVLQIMMFVYLESGS